MAGLAARLGYGEMTPEEWEAFRAPLAQRQARYRDELADLAAQEPEPVPAGLRRLPARDLAWGEWLARWDGATSAERRGMVLRALRGRRLTVDRALVDGHLMVGSGAVRFDSRRVRIVP